jgi:uncharacterized protein (TIGR00106 family)
MIFELSVEPMGKGTHCHDLIARALRVIQASGLVHEVHAMGTNIEGDWADVMPVVRQCMDALYEQGVERLAVTLRISDRRDATPNTIRRSKESVRPGAAPALR